MNVVKGDEKGLDEINWDFLYFYFYIEAKHDVLPQLIPSKVHVSPVYKQTDKLIDK